MPISYLWWAWRLKRIAAREDSGANVEVAELLRELETRLLLASVRADPEELADLLDEDFVEFGSSGRVFDKRQIIEELGNETAGSAVLLTDFKVSILSDEVALATYSTSRNERGATVRARRSSVWRLRDGKWRMHFHQGTRFP